MTQAMTQMDVTEHGPAGEQGAAAQGLPTSPQQILAYLDSLGIAHRSWSHPPVFTVEQAKAERGDLPGGHIKNLFLRNKKGDAMWLVVAQEDRPIDLKKLAALLAADRLSFGSPDRLMTYLGVRPGAVTPLALINDREGKVKVVLDAVLLRLDPVHCHPLTNDMTTALSAQDLLKFIAATGHTPHILDLDGAAGPA